MVRSHGSLESVVALEPSVRLRRYDDRPVADRYSDAL